MAKDFTFNLHWERTSSGLYVPSGTSSTQTRSTSVDILATRDKASAVELLFRSNSVRLPKDSRLAEYLASVRAFADAWMLNQAHRIPKQRILQLANFTQVAEGILVLSRHVDAASYLKRLTKGSVDHLERGPSVAKGALWELELASILQNAGTDARLQDPPDIMMSLNRQPFAIACKTIFSEAHVQNVLSTAVDQVEATNHPGVIAVNIDNLLTNRKVLAPPLASQASAQLDNFNKYFINKHERHFRKYLEKHRVPAVMVSCATVADCKRETPRICHIRMNTMWMLPDASFDSQMCMARFRASLE